MSSSSNRSRSRSPEKNVDDKRIYVTGFSQKETSDDVRKSFEKFGSIDEFSWKGRFCFVAYSKSEEAQAAIEDMNKKDLNGHTLLVELAKAKKQNSACYNCGKIGHFARNCRKGRSSSNNRHRRHKRKHHRSSSSGSSSSSTPVRKRKSKKSKRKYSSSSSDSD